jgi:phosphoenolpyruvate carboxykinase (ATP)
MGSSRHGAHRIVMKIKQNYTREELINIAVESENCMLTVDSALCAWTGDYTGRSPGAKRFVVDSLTEDVVDWNNNQKLSSSDYVELRRKFEEHLDHLTTVFLQEVSAVRDPAYKLSINVYTEFAKHSLFARNMFIPEDDSEFVADYTIYHFPTLLDEPTVVISLEERVILISGTLYSGEIKKSIFTVLNYWFPRDWGFLPMHCSVNIDNQRSNPTIFFGLSGTGKTTLSSDEDRILIGDDEHGWTDKGLVNFEGGCYAKTIRLSKEDEPQIWKASNNYGAILENVVVDKSGVPDFNDSKYTQNSRSSYPTSFINNADELGYVDEHPRNIVMLTCDSFGVLPPVVKLSADEAVKQFLLGYTAKVAGTESGVVEPRATFSPCFGLPFMPLPPEKYGEILKKKIQKHKVDCWLVNTGWTGGGYGIGKRMPIKITREIIKMINNGSLSSMPLENHEHTGFKIPSLDSSIIPKTILKPEFGWSSMEDYKKESKRLLKLFNDERLKLGISE